MTSGSSLRGAGFAPALAAQRAYAAKGGGKAKLGLVVPEAFVRGIRDLGYRSNGDALAELIDNAIQAYADRIDVVFGFDEHGSAKKPSQVAVIDNGHGMEPDMSLLTRCSRPRGSASTILTTTGRTGSTPFGSKRAILATVATLAPSHCATPGYRRASGRSTRGATPSA